MGKTTATQENYSRSRNNPNNGVIYTHLKEEELLRLTDEEFEILQTKLKPVTSTGGNNFFYDFYNGSEATGLKGDETMLNIYKRIMAAHSEYLPCFDRYSRIFSFCHVLEITNLYDIGCGNQLQAFLLMYTPEMNYTGIDNDIFHDYPDNFIADPVYINELFKKFTGTDRIKFIKETYPFDLTTTENNIAICSYCLFGISADDEKRKNSAAAFSKDFERVLFNLPFREYNLTGMNIKDIIYNEVEVWINPFEKYYGLWKNAMPDFEFYKIGEPNFIFGTKIAEDSKKLEKNYTIIDNRVMTGVIDIPWHITLRF